MDIENFISNEEICDRLTGKTIMAVELGDDLLHDQREITLIITPDTGSMTDALRGLERICIKAFTNNNYHEPARLMFERQP